MAGKPKKPAAPAKTKWLREFSAGFILFRPSPAGPLFLLLDYGKHWDYPKGHLEAGETPWDAALRELEEETGISRVTRVPGFEEKLAYFFYAPRKGRIYKTVTFFLARTKDEKVRLSHEHTGHAWLGYEEALSRLTYENAREMLRKAHRALESAK